MEDFILKLIEMSISASWLVLVVLVLRILLRKSPRWIHVCLWALVAVRLVCPVSVETNLSLTPAELTERVMEALPNSYYGDGMIYSYGSENYDLAVSAGIEPEEGDNGYLYVLTQPDDPTKPVHTMRMLWDDIWLLGMAAMVCYAVISYLRLKQKVSASIHLDNGVFLCDYIDTPFILGIIRPRIYLPSSMEPDSAAHVLAHERAHIARKDHWWKPLGYALLTIHWFNPVIWLAYALLCRDIELACDEKVIRRMELPQKKAYSEALLNCSVKRMHIAVCPLAFGEVGVKQRVKSVMNYKKPTVWIVLVAVIILVASAVCFLTDPVEKEKPVMEITENETITNIHELNWLYWARYLNSEYSTTLQFEAEGQLRSARVTFDGDGYTISDGAGTRSYAHCVKSQGESEKGTITEYFFLTDDPQMTIEKYRSEADIQPTELLHMEIRRFDAAQSYGEVPKSMTRLMDMGDEWSPRFYCQDSVFYFQYAAAMSSVRVAYGLTRVDYHGNQLCEITMKGIPQEILELEDGGFAVYTLSYEDSLHELNCYDELGELRWCYSFEEAGGCYVAAMDQKNGDIYCFGEVTPKDSSSDIFIWRISPEGELVQKLQFGGSDFDSVYRALETKKGFTLYGSTQSGDGDLPLSENGYGVGFRVEISDDLELGRAKKADVRYSGDAGYHEGKTVFLDDPILDMSSDDLLPEFLHCSANIFDWEDGYVVVRTLHYEAYPFNHPMVSMMSYYNQVVMTGYDAKGNSVWQLAGAILGG